MAGLEGVPARAAPVANKHHYPATFIISAMPTTGCRIIQACSQILSRNDWLVERVFSPPSFCICIFLVSSSCYFSVNIPVYGISLTFEPQAIYIYLVPCLLQSFLVCLVFSWFFVTSVICCTLSVFFFCFCFLSWINIYVQDLILVCGMWLSSGLFRNRNRPKVFAE